MGIWTEPGASAEVVDISSGDHTVSDEIFGRGLWVGGSGNVKVDLDGPNGSGITFQGVQAGSLLPLRVTKVYQTGTTATLMVVVG